MCLQYTDGLDPTFLTTQYIIESYFVHFKFSYLSYSLDFFCRFLHETYFI